MSTHLPIASAKQSWRALGRHLPTAPLIGAAILILAGSAVALAIPALLGLIVDAVVDGSDFSLISWLAAAIAGSGLVSAVVLAWGSRVMVRAMQTGLAGLREEALTAAVRLDQGLVEDAGTSDVVSRVTGDVEAITDAVSDVLPRFVQAAFAIALTVVGLAAIDPRLALAALVVVPVQYVGITWFMRRSRPLYRRLRVEESDRGQAIIDAVRGSDTAIAYAKGTEHAQRVAHRTSVAVETSRDTALARNIFNSTINGAEFIGLATILAVGFWLAVSEDLSVGAVTAAALFFHRLFNPIGAVLFSLDDLQRAAAGLGRLVGVMLARNEPEVRVEPADSGVEVSGVSFRYREGAALALQGIDLTVRAGETVVLVGASGSGKSTLAQLIAGTTTPTSGHVRVGGVDAHRAGAHRRAVLLVTQETHVFRGSIADNLRLARADATDDELAAALTAVGATWFRNLEDGINAAAEGLDHARLQQCALARVVLADPAVVVLDEATAHGAGALDAGVTAAVNGRTAVIVAHRFTQTAVADRIIVMEAGRIVESGTHAELIALAGRYARLYALAQPDT